MNINIEKIGARKYIDAVKSVLSADAKKACIITFGCQQNEADSEKIRAMAVMMGYSLTDTPEGADLVVINTCAIREHAELKALSVVGRFKAEKKKNKDLIVAVVGCMAAEEHVAEKIKKSYPYVSFTLEPALIYKFPELLYKSLSENKRSFVFGCDEGHIVEGIEPVRASNHRAWVSIMYGCNNFCSYCIVPYVRGRERSRDSSDIIRECESLAASGYKEITLLGQNVNSYKSDMDFATLLERVAEIPGDFTVRFMTSHPKDVSDRLIEVVGKYTGKIAPSFHLPLQSGSDSVLLRMNRTYNTERYLSIVKKLRESVPGISITSDIIVGFPGESEKDFEDTLDIMKKIKFDMVYSFIYSVREGTRAAGMDNHIPDDVKSARMSRLLLLQDEISLEKNLSYVGRVERVLVDGISKCDEGDIYSARTATNRLVHFKSDKDFTGQYINIKIKRAGAYILYGEISEGENKDD